MSGRNYGAIESEGDDELNRDNIPLLPTSPLLSNRQQSIAPSKLFGSSLLSHEEMLEQCNDFDYCIVFPLKDGELSGKGIIFLTGKLLA